MEARHTQVRSPHENGKVEQAHYRVKKAIANQLTLRGSSDFESRRKYEAFLAILFVQLNRPRKERFEEERAHMGPLPKRPLTTYKPISVRVSKGSTIRVQNNFYSVPSRRIGERVDVRLYGEEVQVWYRNRVHGADAAVTRQEQASDWVQTCHFLVSAQAWGVCGLPIPIGFLSHPPVPDGL